MVTRARQVLFFGAIAGTIIGQEVYDRAAFDELESQDAFIQLQLTASAEFQGSEEIIGSTSTSGPYELHSAADAINPHASSQFLSVMVERVQNVSLDSVPHNEEYVDQGSGDSVCAETDSHLDPTAVVMSVSADIFRSGCKPSLIANKQVHFRSLSERAAKDMCCVVRLAILPQLLNQSCVEPLTLHDVESAITSGYNDESAVAVVYVMLRVVDLSRNLSMALDAEVQLRHQMNLPEPAPGWDLSFTRKVKVPYGVMPLSQLYEHYRQFFSKYYNTNVKCSAEVLQMLRTVQEETNAPYPNRWNLLTKVCLDHVLLGEKGLAPLLLTLSHCPNLSSLIASNNNLSDVPCAWLCALFHKHRYLHTISLTNNIIYEGGADQLLRLARRNHRLTKVQLDGNYCSQGLLKRLQYVTKCSSCSMQDDPLNIMSPAYAEITSPASVPVPVIVFALQVWAMLAAAPVGDVDVWVRNSTTMDMDQYEDSSLQGRSEAFEAAEKAPRLSIPLSAYAPLLSEIMRTVYLGIAAVIEDPLVRTVFMDIQALHDQREELRLKDRDKANPQKAASSPDLSVHENVENHRLPVDTERSDGVPLPGEIKRLLEKDADCDGAAASASSGWVEEEEEIYQSSFLNIIVVTFRALAGGSNWADAVQSLRHIGKQQREIGVQDEDYWLAANIFMRSLQICLGSEENAPKMLSAFFNVLVLGVRTAVASPALENS
ncbi:unnamed protein product [Phytomonas sp. EM1]|nr:unnamed protein product [Phytomonas sp. EM1]|eukprot:CCW63814.1 unnamed protein product [Phytomonas sp. isolate EM1]